MEYNMKSILKFSLLLLGCQASGQEFHRLLRMPHVHPTQEDLYLCTSFELPKQGMQNIIGFDPKSTKNVHHMLIYGCKVPGHQEAGNPQVVWNCPEHPSQPGIGYAIAPACDEGTVIYSWTHQAAPLHLPPGVAYRIAGDSDINYLVLQAHYIHVDAFADGSTDDSGIVLTMLPGSASSITKSAGILLVETGGRIPAHSEEHMEGSCLMSEPLTLHPFAYRTHTHHLGTAVTGWKVSRDGEWSLIGRKNPQLPQSFYPIEDKNLTIGEGDIVATRCVMVNPLDHEVRIGDALYDEMCRFYVMYYTDGTHTLANDTCTTPGPPEYYWYMDPLIGAPPADIDKSASLAQ